MSEMSVMTHVHVYFYEGRHTFPSCLLNGLDAMKTTKILV